jgi:3-phosphoshikimate 1-carboxyvinyltransferase
MKEIKSHKISGCRISVPGSKSYTHRMLIAAALAKGASTLKNALISEDTQFTIDALRQMGIEIKVNRTDVRVMGQAGHLESCDEPIFLGNSGTSMRLLAATAALGKGTYTLTGTARMQMRPIKDLLSALQEMGVRVQVLNGNDCPPVEVTGGTISADKVRIKCQQSSQYLSALLLMAPCTRNGLEIRVTDGPVSRPYVDLTIELLKTFGIRFEREGYRKFKVPGEQVYRAGKYVVEADCSQAAYFWSAAAISGAKIKVAGINSDSAQGDVRFVDLLEQMGCLISRESDGIAVAGGPLRAIEADMAAFARGISVIKNVAHLRSKESDRLTATVTELKKMGIGAACTDNGLVVWGGMPRGSVIDTYNDHRIAMSFAIAGLNVPGVCIRGEDCVGKSFPGFWRVFEELYQS